MKKIQYIIISFLFLGQSIALNAQTFTGNKPSSKVESNSGNAEDIENYLKQSDQWSIVIDSQSVRIYEKEKKKNIAYSNPAQVKLSDKEAVVNSGKKKDARIIIKKTADKNTKAVAGNPAGNNNLAVISGKAKVLTDTLNKQPDSLAVAQDMNNGTKTVNYDTSRTINYDDSRTINVDNNRDQNKGSHMNKNRDRDRDLRRDLKRDKSRDRGRDKGRDAKRDKGRDMKRDKNRDRGSSINSGNRFKIKINLKN